MRIEGGRLAGPGVASPTGRHRVVTIILIVLFVGLLFTGWIGQQSIRVLADSCTQTEALVQIVTWSEESEQWGAEGQLYKATATHACVPTETMRLRS